MAVSKYIVEGFEFPNEQLADGARSELKGIDYIVSRTDMSNSKSVLVLYNSIIDKNLFKTPIGIKFLKEIQEMLIASNDIDEKSVKPIPVRLEELNVEKNTNEKTNYKKIMINSIIVNIILIFAIIIMYMIFSNSKNINIINYENRLKEQYSALESNINIPN